MRDIIATNISTFFVPRERDGKLTLEPCVRLKITAISKRSIAAESDGAGKVEVSYSTHVEEFAFRLAIEGLRELSEHLEDFADQAEAEVARFGLRTEAVEPTEAP